MEKDKNDVVLEREFWECFVLGCIRSIVLCHLAEVSPRQCWVLHPRGALELLAEEVGDQAQLLQEAAAPSSRQVRAALYC